MNNKKIDIKGELVYIPIEKLFPHPDNPRKELGDLTELADSIKAKGIMQNLTVVPKEKDTYTVVIGHRRLGASKVAGLTELPCVIANMSPKEQIATMVAENMQRSDLTIYEEACGMQMMLDFGDTLESVSEQTGLSKTTVRRRVKLLDLDKDKFQASLGRGATLMDYEKLDKIKDNDLKNKLLDALGTSNFDWEYQKALKAEKTKEIQDGIVEKLNTFATPIEDVKALKYVQFISLTGNGEFEIPDDAETIKYFYKVNENGTWIGLYVEKTEADLEKENIASEKAAKSQQKKAIHSEVAQRAFELRKDFIRHASISNKEHTEELIKFAFTSIIKNQTNYRTITDEEFCMFAGLGEDDSVSGTISDIISGDFGMVPKRALLLGAYCNFHDSEKETYSNYDYGYERNNKLEIIYNFLEKIGYECSDEERAWREGTHEIFDTDKE